MDPKAALLELKERIERRFDPAQPRDPHTGKWASVGGLKRYTWDQIADLYGDQYDERIVDRDSGIALNIFDTGDIVLLAYDGDPAHPDTVGVHILYDGFDADSAHHLADQLDWAVKASNVRRGRRQPADNGLIDWDYAAGDNDEDVLVGYDPEGDIRIGTPVPDDDDHLAAIDLSPDAAGDLADALRDFADIRQNEEYRSVRTPDGPGIMRAAAPTKRRRPYLVSKADYPPRRRARSKADASNGTRDMADGYGEDVARHLPGLHDQSSHGRRFKVPGNPKSGLKKALKATKSKSDTKKVPAERKFAPKTVAELQTSQDDYLARTGAKLTDDQRYALKAYSLAAYEGMNGWLRGRKGYENPPEAVRKAVDDARSAMVPLQVDAAFERGATWEGLPEGFRDPQAAKRLVGTTIEDPGFLSTSVPGARLTLRGDVRLTVEAPKGTMGRLVRDVSEIPDEDEYIFAPGTRYEVLEVSGENPTHVRVRAVVP